MNLIKYFAALLMLTMLSACGGGGGSPGTSSGGTVPPVVVDALFTTAPASITLASGTNSLGFNIGGGVSPYTASSDTPSLISVSLSGSTFTISATAAKSGSGSVSIVDSKGTRVSVAVTVPLPTALFTTAPIALTLTSGASSAVYNISGGIAPYTVGSDTPSLVSASLSGTTFTISAAAGKSGSGVVSIIDSAGTRVAVAVTVPVPVALFVDAPANLSISVGAPGSTYTVSGGTAPYTAVSSNTAVATSTTPASNGRFVIQGVSSGNATVTIKDAAGTTLTLSVTVPAPTALFSTAPATLQILNGTTNFYTVFGGTQPYVVNTNGVIARAVISGASLAISGLVPGVQTVAVSDAKGAVITIDVTVKNGLYTDAPANLSVASGTGAMYSVFGGIPFSGTALYRVNSSNPAVASASITGSTLSISGLSVGSTALVISDSVGATASITVTVPVAGAILSTAPSALRLATGTSGVYAISGGVGPYTATSSNPSIVSASANGSTLTIAAVADTVGGVAKVTVTDSVGTLPALTIDVTAAPVQFFTTAPAQLAIAAGGSKAFALFGGTLPYSVVSTHPAVATGSISGSVLTITGLIAGSGTVIVSDAKGVTVSIVVAVNTPGPLYLSAPAGVVTISSGGSNSYDIIGGVPPYLSSSTDLRIARATIVNANQVRIDALGAGNATIAVTDSAGTKVSVVVAVPGASNLVLYTSAPTSGVFLASADVGGPYTIFGGVPFYSVQSSNENVVLARMISDGFTLTAIAAGKAEVLVRDSSGLSVTVPVTVGSVNAFFVAAPPLLNMGAGTASTYQVSGGSKPYIASSSDSRVATAVVDSVTARLTINALTVGNANLLISDAVGGSYAIAVVVDNAGGTGPSAAAAIDILASNNTLNSAPGSVISFIVTVKDGANTAMPNQTVTFTSSSGTLTGANPAPKTNASGTIATVTLSPGADASNRNITVAASTGGISKNITIPVVGTSVAVSGPGAALVGSAPLNFTVKSVDSGGKPIVGASLAITSALGNAISPSAVITDNSGAGTVAFTASNVGTDTLTVTGLGTSGKATVVVSNVDFGFTVPTAAALLPVGSANPVTVRYRVAGVGVAGQTVTFGSTRGSLSANTAVTDINGEATISVSSTTAGPVTVSAQLGTARSSLAASFVATLPASLVLQANPAAVLPNAAGSVANQSALTAVVRDAAGNPVQGVVVNFTAVNDGSNGNIAPGSATTDANGLATAQFIPGPLSTAANGVQIRATVQSNPTITNTAVLTVNGEALFISIGRSGTVTVFDSTTYQKDFSVYVTDANGAPAGNRAVTLSVWPTTYGKGTLSWYDPPKMWSYSAGSPTTCVNEDANKNGILDAGEDINGDGILQPGVPAAITSSVTTDAFGFAPFTVRYGKNYAMWVSTQITAKSLVGGTESKQLQSYDLEMTITDAQAAGSPANVVSPFGTVPLCTDPH